MRIDATREKLYYVPLPRPPRLRVPNLALSATIGHGLRMRHSGRRVAMKWWTEYAHDAMVWTLVMAVAVGVGVVVAWL
jgi:hypothetical protein